MYTVYDIDRIERELDIELPEEYKSILLAYPFAHDSVVYEDDLFGDAATLISRNQESGQYGFMVHDWPSHYLVIGTDGAGNDFFIDLQAAGSAVYIADHEVTSKSKRLEYRLTAPSITDFVDLLKKQEAEFEEEERQAAERRLNRKWWQFWL